MEGKSWYFLIGCLIFVVVVAIVFVVLKPGIFSSPEGVCEAVSVNEGEKKIDLVFFTDGVERSKVDEYVNFFLSSEPFSENKEKFNFYYAGNADCDLKQGNLLFCYSRNLIVNSKICENDYVVVLSAQGAFVRSTAYMDVMSINVNQNKNVLLHEFGHVFANLADEYVPSEIPRGAKNCDKNCDEFGEECYAGCSESDYFRSSSNSVMRTLSTGEYYSFNVNILNQKMEKYV